MPPPRPSTLIAELTYQCPLHCPYCSNPADIGHPKYSRKHELSTDDWARVFREASALGVLQAQTVPRWDVVSIHACKGNDPDGPQTGQKGGRSGGLTSSNGRLNFPCLPLRFFLQRAYLITNNQLASTAIGDGIGALTLKMYNPEEQLAISDPSIAAVWRVGMLVMP